MPSSPTHEHPWIESSARPLYIFSIPKERKPGELEAALKAVGELYNRTQQRIVWVVDGSALIGGTIAERKLIVRYEGINKENAMRWNAGMAIVAPTAIVRGLYTAITWLAPPVYDTKVVATLAEGMAWAREALSKDSILPPPASTLNDRRGRESA